MDSFLVTLLICSGTMSALALFYMAITPLLAKQYSVTGCYYTWLVIVAGLIIPFRPHFNNAIVRVDMPGRMAAPVIQTGAGTPAAAPVQAAIPPAFTNLSWQQIAAAVWLAGMVLFLTYHIIRHYRFLKLTARWSDDIQDEQTLSLFRDLKTQMGITGQIGLQVCDTIGSPMMTGFANPRILLPPTGFAKDELCFILKHELVHYKRRDLWYKCLVLTAAAVHWFNPIVHLMAKVIDLQCELSCDAEVVRSTGAGTRLHYSETIISVVRHHSKLKTSLSTNFYGGKKGMKKRIFSIMDMNKKKAGAAVLFCALLLTLGTGFAFAENTAPSFYYSFRPDPELYSQYSSYGIEVSDNGEMLLYNGKRVRLFVDEHSDTEAFFMDEAGSLDLSVVRNAAGQITGVESIPEHKAEEYRSAFFAEDTKSSVEVHETVQEAVHETAQDVDGENKFQQYAAYGILPSADGEVLYHNGQRVKLLVDAQADGNFETFWTDEAGTVNLSVARNLAGQITAIESLTEEQAQTYFPAADKYEKKVLNGLEEKIEAKLKEKYPED